MAISKEMGGLNGFNKDGIGSVWAFEQWQTPTLLNSWINRGTPFANIRYRRDPLGRVWFEGVIRNGVTDTVAFVLPPSHRPITDKAFSTAGTTSANSCRIVIRTNGDVEVQTSNTNFVGFDGVVYQALEAVHVEDDPRYSTWMQFWKG